METASIPTVHGTVASSTDGAVVRVRRWPQPLAVLELLKPVTWFPPMWAFACGAVSSGQSFSSNWLLILAGVVLAGPLVCAMSQAINDWYDRHVDAINEPNRPIPSGRLPGRWGLYVALVWTGLSLLMGFVLGPVVLGATVVGLLLAWAYSAPPLRLKNNGWLGAAACALCYEGLAWFTGAAVLLSAFPDGRIVALALLYSLGAHGIMVLNDFKSIEGDRAMGVNSLPVQLGAARAAHVASVTMAVPQGLVVALLWHWGQGGHALAVALLLVAQLGFMAHYLWNGPSLDANPRRNAAFYNLFGVTAYVSGMMVSAFAIGALTSGAGA